MKDYYGILEVSEKASNEVIEKAYKTLVKKYHPDLYSTMQKKEAEQKLKDINEAYKILSDNFLRSQYDLELQKEKLNLQTNIHTNYDTNIYKQNYIKNNINNKKVNNSQYERKNSNVGTIFGLVELLQEVWKSRPKNKEKKQMTNQDWIAIGLTIVVLIILGVLLWFIPLTNGWMRELLFENPIFELISNIFS